MPSWSRKCVLGSRTTDAADLRYDIALPRSRDHEAGTAHRSYDESGRFVATEVASSVLTIVMSAARSIVLERRLVLARSLHAGRARSPTQQRAMDLRVAIDACRSSLVV